MRWIVSLVVVSGGLMSVASRSEACGPAVSFVGTTSVVASSIAPVAPAAVVSPTVVVPTAVAPPVVATPIVLGHGCLAPTIASTRVAVSAPFTVRSVQRTVVRQRIGLLPRVRVSIR